MATTTFTNATDYGPDDSINSAVNVTGMTVANVTNVRLEIDWNPNGADPSCGGDAASSSCVVTNPAGGTTTMFNSYDKSGTSARTDTYDITSSFPGTFNGNWTFTLEDEDMMGCNTVTETRVIVTHSGVTNAPVVGDTTELDMQTSTGVAINKPASTAEGDLLLLVVQTHSEVSILDPIEGFSHIHKNNPSNDVGAHYVTILYKIATDSEPSSYTLSYDDSTSEMFGASLTRVSNVDTACPIGPVGFVPFSSSTTTNAKGLPLPPAGGDCVVFRVASIDDNIRGLPNATPDSGFTEVYNDQNISGLDNTLLVGHDTAAYAGDASIPELGWTAAVADKNSRWTIVVYGASNQSGKTLSVPRVRSVETQGSYNSIDDSFIKKPSGVQPGDLLMAFVAEGGDATLEFTSLYGEHDFTTIQTDTLHYNTSSAPSRYLIAYRIATATEPDYYTVNQSDIEGGIIRITDYDPTNIFGTYGLASGVRIGQSTDSTPPQSGEFPIASGLDSDSLLIKGVFFSEHSVLAGGYSSFTPSGDKPNGAHTAGVLFEEESQDNNDYTIGVYQEAGGSASSRASYWYTDGGYGNTDSHMAFAIGINSGGGSGVPAQSSGTVVPVVHATVVNEIDATAGNMGPVSINKPADTAAGDLLLATAVANNEIARDSFHSNGFNFFLTSPSPDNTTLSRQTYLAYKIATASEPASYDFDIDPGGTTKIGISLTRISNVDTLCPIGALRIYEEDTAFIHQSPPIEIDGDSLVFRLSSVEDDDTYYPDTSITELVGNETTTTSDTSHFFGYDTVSYGSGATAIGRGWTGTSDPSMNVSFVVYGSGQSNRVASGPILHSVSEFNFVSETNQSEEIDKPAGTTEGDLLVFFAVNPKADNDGDNPKLTDESFTPVSSGALRSAYSDYLIAYKIATASEPSTYTLFPSTAGGALCRISNFDSSDPIDFASSHLLRSDYGMDSGVYPPVTAGCDNPLVLRGIMYSNATPMSSFQLPFMADSGTYPTLITNNETDIYNDAQIHIHREAGGERNVREGRYWHNDGTGLTSDDYILPFTMAINSAVPANPASTASLGVEVIGVPYGDSAQTAALGVEVLGDGGATPVGNPAGLGIEVLGNAGSGPVNNPSISSLGVEVISQGSGPANNPSISAFGVEVISSGIGPVDKIDVFTLGIEVVGNATPASSNNLRFGNSIITKAYLGSQQLSKIRLGEQVIEL